MAKKQEKTEEEVAVIAEEKKPALEQIMATKSLEELVAIVSALSAAERNELCSIVADKMDTFIG